MKLFHCPVCSGRLYFDNDHCVACGTPIAFDDLPARWLVLAEAANSINRCMGMRDL